MEFKFLPPLEHMSAIRIAELLIQHEDLGWMFDRDLSIPYQTRGFNNIRHNLWKEIEREVRLKLANLPKSVCLKVVKIIQPMHFQAVMWLKDHDSLPHRKGFCLKYRKLLCWNDDGSIDRAETAKKFIQDESLDVRDRFVMACNYLQIEEILELWNVVRIMNLNCTSRRGINAAVRLWVDMLRIGCTEPSNEMIETYFSLDNLKPSDIPLRLSSYFRYLSPTLRHDYFTPRGLHHLHEDDFRLCIPQMNEAERTRLFNFEPLEAISHYLEWPFEFLFIEEARKMSSKLKLVDYVVILDVILKLFMLCGDVYADLMKKFWAKIPASIKRQIRRTEHFDIYDIILKYRQNNFRALQEIIGLNYSYYLM